MTGGRVALVLGGARSGKSAEAERLVTGWAGGRMVTYVATAALDVDDPSLAARIDTHRARRPATWATVDAGRDLCGVLRSTPGSVLLDSLGPWVAAWHPDAPDPAELVAALISRQADTVVVSDEVGLAVHPVSESGRWFVDALGTLNQAVAAVAVDVRLVVAGRVLALPVGHDPAALEPVVPLPDPTPPRDRPGVEGTGPDDGAERDLTVRAADATGGPS